MRMELPHWLLILPFLLPPPFATSRHFVAWIGSLPATKENFKKLLKKGSCAVVVGGIAEVRQEGGYSSMADAGGLAVFFSSLS